MSKSLLNPVELRERGFEALVQALGWLDAVRFIQQFDLGHGNYTEERRQILPDWDVDTLVQRAAGMVRDTPGRKTRATRKPRRPTEGRGRALPPTRPGRPTATSPSGWTGR